MIRRIAIVSVSSALLFAAACAGAEKEPAKEPAKGDQVPVEPGAPVAADSSDSAAGDQVVDTASVSVDVPAQVVAAAHSEVEFASFAFPPTLPRDDSHVNAWLRKDCIMCQETGIAGAPVVQHRGMSSALLGAQCRTCHVVAGAPSAGEVTFLRRAFPPTLPMDVSHENSWLRDDCLKCHEAGLDGAPQVRLQGMAELLLEARCRSCHLPSGPTSDEQR